MSKYPDHTPMFGDRGGCMRLIECECERAKGRHCASCGVAIFTEATPSGGSWTGHVGGRERLWALERERREQDERRKRRKRVKA